MQSTLCLPVPSRNLLRFLRCQSKRAFSNANHGRTSMTTPVPCCRARTLDTLTTRKQFTTLGTACQRTVTIPRLTLFQRDPTSPKLQDCHQPWTSQRCFSTSQGARKLFKGQDPNPESPPTWERFLKLAGRKDNKVLKPDDLPNHDEYSDGSSIFNNRRTLAAKAASEPRLRCTEVDEHGNVILVDGEFKKTELIAKVRVSRPQGKPQEYNN